LCRCSLIRPGFTKGWLAPVLRGHSGPVDLIEAALLSFGGRSLICGIEAQAPCLYFGVDPSQGSAIAGQIIVGRGIEQGRTG
jgi:hypothetical protein